MSDVNIELVQDINDWLRDELDETCKATFEAVMRGVPNEETRQAINDADNGVNLTRYKNADDMFEKMGI